MANRYSSVQLFYNLPRIGLILDFTYNYFTYTYMFLDTFSESESIASVSFCHRCPKSADGLVWQKKNNNRTIETQILLLVIA